MEVNRTSFPHHLLGMIVNISEADFVSFDLEFSGIPSRMPGRPQKRDRATLEDRYRETKAGAEKYQILQFGFTCATFDHIKNKYVLRPYNVNINPMLEEGFHFERDVSFQSGAVAFLREHGFDMNMPFTKGVPYLSRDEAARARQMAYDRIDRTNVIADIQLKDTDVDSLDFVRRAREAITNWKAGNFMGLEITSHTGLKNQPALTSISNFEKRLVHQLVRAEFPDVVAMGRADHIKIIDYDAVRESEHARRQKNRVKDQIVGQTGFRWVIEAMGNGDLDSIDPMSFAKNVDGISTAADLDHIKSKFHRALMRLKDRQGVLVGHNMFTDLVYLYHTFIGPLPDTLKEFCALTHELFPRIVDTKYLATYAGGDLNRSPPLEEIAEEYATQPLPDIVVDAAHSKYNDTEAFHEAGFDSLQTATIMLRLSAKLGAESDASKQDTDHTSDTTYASAPEYQDPMLIDGREHVREPIGIPPVQKTAESPILSRSPARKHKAMKKNGKKSKKSVDSRFVTKNAFDALQGPADTDAEQDEDEEQTPPYDPEHEQQGDGFWVGKEFPQPELKDYPIVTRTREPMEMMPDFNSDFWHSFGNRLRVFGTQELVLQVAEWEGKRVRKVEEYRD